MLKRVQWRREHFLGRISMYIRDLKHWLIRYSEKNIDSIEINKQNKINDQIISAFQSKGLFGLLMEKKYGGSDISLKDFYEIIELLASIDLNLAVLVAGHNVTACFLQSILEKNSDFLCTLAQGQQFVGFSVTESTGGSNPRAIECVLKKEGKHYLLSGQKYYSGLASLASHTIVFARYEGEEKSGALEYVAILVPMKAEGVYILDKLDNLGLKGIPKHNVKYENVYVNEDQILFGPTIQLSILQQVMNLARFSIGAMSLGVLKRCIQLMLRYTTQRHIITGKLLDNPAAREIINVTIFRTYALEKLIRCFEKQTPMNLPEELIIVLKNLGAEFSNQAADDLIQLLGGRGYEEKNIAPRLWRDSRTLRIFEGPTEALLLHLGILFRKLSKSLPLKQRLANNLGFDVSKNGWLEKLNDVQAALESVSMDFSFMEYAIFLCLGKIGSVCVLNDLLNANSPCHIEKAAKIYFEGVCQELFDQYTRDILQYKNKITALPYAAYENQLFESLGSWEQKPQNEAFQLDTYLSPNRDRTSVSDLAQTNFVSVAQWIFHEQSNRTDRVLVQQGDQVWTIQQIGNAAVWIAKSLQEQGLKKGDRILLYIDKSPLLIAAIEACILAGYPFLMVTPSAAQDRLKEILKTLEPSKILCQPKNNNLFSKTLCHEVTLNLKICEEFSYSFSDFLEKEKVYYVATSGTTGVPNIVEVSHASAIQMITATQETYHIHSNSKLYLFSALDFDVAISDILAALCFGVTLCLPSRVQSLPDSVMVKELQSYEVTHIQMVASALALLPKEDFPKLECIVVGGEVCPVSLMKEWSKVTTIYNAYGPAEATVVSTVHRFTGDENAFIPLGKPLRNKKVYVMSSTGVQAKIGEAGELLIGGWLSSGYLRREDLNQKRFISDPFCEGEIVYKTGDLVRQWENGVLEFVGRIDHQIKIHGIRVEPEEIEKHLKEISGISEALVGISCLEDGSKQLAAYLSLEKPLYVSTVRQKLLEKVSASVVPSCFFETSDFNYTSNGKLNRKHIPNAASCKLLSDASNVLRTLSLFEEEVLQIWQKVLGTHSCTHDTNFFHAGGDSLSIVRLASHFREKLKRDISIDVFFENETIEKQAKYLEAEISQGRL